MPSRCGTLVGSLGSVEPDASGTSEIDDAAVLDLDNLVAGLQTAIRLAEPEAAAGCAVAAGRRLHQRGPQRRGLDLAMRALQVAPEHSGLLAMAARLAIGQGEPLARTWAEHARANARDPRERAMASLVLGEVQMSDAAYGEATTTLTRALQEARQLGDTVTEAHAALSLGGLQILTHDERARGNLGFALHLARRVGHRSVHIGALVGLGRLETVRGDLDGARRWIEQSLELASGHPIERARAHAVLGATLSSQGDGGLARQHLHSALEIFRQLGMRRSELPVLANLAIVAAAEGNLVEACARQEEGLVLAGDLGDPMQVSSHSINLGFTLHRGGQLQRSRELFEQVRSDHLDSDLPDLLGFANLHLALHEVEVGQLQAALQRCEANTEHVFALGSHGSLLQAATAAALAHILNDLGRHEAALAAAERSLSVSTGDPVARSMGLVERGVSLERLGRDGGEEALQMARQSVGESDDQYQIAMTDLRLAEVALAANDDARAQRLVTEAVERGLDQTPGLHAHARGLLALLSVAPGGAFVDRRRGACGRGRAHRSWVRGARRAVDQRSRGILSQAREFSKSRRELTRAVGGDRLPSDAVVGQPGAASAGVRSRHEQSGAFWQRRRARLTIPPQIGVRQQQDPRCGGTSRQLRGQRSRRLHRCCEANGMRAAFGQESALQLGNVARIDKPWSPSQQQHPERKGGGIHRVDRGERCAAEQPFDRAPGGRRDVEGDDERSTYRGLCGTPGPGRAESR